MRKAYPSDVSDEEWAFSVGYLTLMREDAPQREYPLRELFDALRWMVRTGGGLPHAGEIDMVGVFWIFDVVGHPQNLVDLAQCFDRDNH